MNKPGRNDPCFCGSGVKYKKCCIGKLTPTQQWVEDDLALGQKLIAEFEEEQIKAGRMKPKISFNNRILMAAIMGGLVSAN
jgi:hypothetical protein